MKPPSGSDATKDKQSNTSSIFSSYLDLGAGMKKGLASYGISDVDAEAVWNIALAQHSNN